MYVKNSCPNGFNSVAGENTPDRNYLLIIAYLLKIESSHSILFLNRDEIVEMIGPLVTNARQAQFAADQINSWVTDNLASGDVMIPENVIHQIFEQLRIQQDFFSRAACRCASGPMRGTTLISPVWM
jgi:hypothetical protein